MSPDPGTEATQALVGYKEAQKLVWSGFAPLATMTTPAAARLVRHARVHAGQRVLDVACGTGVVAITAARLGAQVTGLDLTPPLLQHARENAETAGAQVDWHEGDVEDLPFGDETFDVVLSQFGHIFAPRPGVAISEMLRVLKRGGTVAFSTWPPNLFVGRLFALVAHYLPAPPPGAKPPQWWGEPAYVRDLLGERVADVSFDTGRMWVPALSPQHSRAMTERSGGPVVKLVEMLTATDPERLASLRTELEAIAADYFEDNTIRQDYLLTRARRI